MKIKFLILTCRKNLETKAKSILDTWGVGQEIVFLSDYGNNHNTVSFQIPPDYAYMSMRYSNYIKSLTDLGSDWYFFCDDDTFVNTSNLENLLLNFNSNEPFYIGKKLLLTEKCLDSEGNYTGFPIHSLKGDRATLPLNYTSGGAGFALSNSSISMLKNYLNLCKDTPYSYNTDVTMGLWMRNCGVALTDNDGFNTNTPINHNHKKDKIKKSLTYHYLNTQEMYYINEII